MELKSIAKELNNIKEKIILIYAFNATGKTRLSVAYKDATKKDDQHAGVYYNAFSEDIFFWNNEEDMCLRLNKTNLNKLHSSFTEKDIFDKLKPFMPKFDFDFHFHDDQEDGIESISFYLLDDEHKNRIKISRGEERIFVWCFFLALFEVDGWADQQSSHFFIDDPVSSLDDNNLFITASTILDLIDTHAQNRKIVITTHHVGLFSTLSDWLTKGEKSKKFEKKTKLFILSKKSGELVLESPKNNVFLYHLHLLQVIDEARNSELYTFHFVLLRQVLENISSFLGAGYFGYVLDQLGYKGEELERLTRIINSNSHQQAYTVKLNEMNENNKRDFAKIFDQLKNKYKFKLHT